MRQLKRLDSIIPGRVNAIYGESDAGIAVIRAFGAQSMVFNGMSHPESVAKSQLLNVAELMGTFNMKVCANVTWNFVARWLFCRSHF